MGAHCVQSQSCGFGMRALALVWRCYCRIGARTLWQTYRCVIPLEHERVHLLGSHVFSALFGALFYARAVVAPMLADFDHKLLWPEFSALWPNAGPAELTPPFEAMGPWPIPTINTALLLSSGATLTVAHHALRDGQRRAAIFWLAATVGLGFCFLCLQGYEYRHAYRELNLKLSSGVYGSIFFLLTGFHGFHVMLGVLMLTVVLMRLARGHFRPDHHFAFEGAAWYWHFVDVVWLGLYVVVYWL